MSNHTDEEIIQAVDNFPGGCKEQKDEFLKSLNIKRSEEKYQVELTKRQIEILTGLVGRMSDNKVEDIFNEDRYKKNGPHTLLPLRRGEDEMYKIYNVFLDHPQNTVNK
jgi:hypothetical protein